ncbi:MAG: 16S rRNA (cytidine(1402)-2'-O)-methyltransferase [Anaerolineae bacterium]|nr:16S rRNA (cytidine(1402)-2'-O)-methyltransferase [Anaerolineae bacterium]MDW8171701.1 16S rRNA (cytidine(1402)-2'-O)-methyltransferase [Anaerolineae bacterium]
MGTLYLVATPIGNLEDMTLRALRILKEVRLIAAEDTRTSRVLLQHFRIETPLTSYHEHNKLHKVEVIFDALALGDVALISDAGTPAISDPGYELVKLALARGVRVVPIPGASAVVTALVASGLPTDGFVYLGFLPRKDSDRRKFLESLRREPRTLIAYESPHRLSDALRDVQAVLGQRPVCVAREMTKHYEEFFRGTVSEALARFQDENPKGEITLLIGGALAQEARWDEARVRDALRQRLQDGESLSSAAKQVASEALWRKGEVYNLGLSLADGGCE